MDTTVISAAMVYKLLKQLYCDAGCFPNYLTQSIYESIFQSVPCFSHVPAITNLTAYCMQLFLQKMIWLPRLLLQYTKLHTVTPPYLQYVTYVPNWSSQVSNYKIVTNNIDKINGSFLKHINNYTVSLFHS